jgi:G:T-mismatch repair DNA endonuclease (very short patch repair protein)
MGKTERMLEMARRQSQKSAKEQKLRASAEARGQEFCRCYAVLEDGSCPRCTLMKNTFLVFCKRCLYVHPNKLAVPCKEWRPDVGN